MLYTVFTSFRARDNETGYIRLMHITEKIEAPDKFTAKAIAWRRISESDKYSFITFERQNARAAKRKPVGE